MRQTTFLLRRGYIFFGTIYVFLTIWFTQDQYISWALLCGLTLILFLFLRKFRPQILFSILLWTILWWVSSWIHTQWSHQLSHFSPQQILTWIVIQQTAIDRRNITTSQGNILLTTNNSLTPGDSIAFLPTLPWYEKYPSPQAERYKKRLHLKWYQASLTTYSLSLLWKQKLSYLVLLKEYLLDRFTLLWLNPTTQALLRGMIWWDTSSLTRTQLDQFVASGLIHIVAVSGSNIAFVVLLGHFFFRRVPVSPRFLLLMVLVFAYATLCGWESSVVRAVCFGLITLGTLLLGTPKTMWSLFWMVAVSMLWWHPDIFWYDRGRRLSFSATGTIMLFTSLFPQQSSRYMKWLTTLLVPTIAATLGTFPLLLLFNNTYTLGSVVANLLASLLLPRLIRGSILALLLWSRTPYIPFLSSLLDRWVTTLFDISETTILLSPTLFTSTNTTYSMVLGVIILVWWSGYILYQKRKI